MKPTLARPRPPIFLDEVLPDPQLVRSLLERHGPYLPVVRPQIVYSNIT